MPSFGVDFTSKRFGWGFFRRKWGSALGLGRLSIWIHRNSVIDTLQDNHDALSSAHQALSAEVARERLRHLKGASAYSSDDIAIPLPHFLRKKD